MVKLNLFDIQGFVARGYNFPRASYLLAEIPDYKAGREFVGRVTEQVTSAERWEQGKPPSTLNIGFTWKGLRKLGLPDATLLSFPDELYQGMRARNRILGDVGKNDPANWDSVWKEEIHVWLGVSAQTPDDLARRCDEMGRLMQETGGARLLYAQQASAIYISGQPTPNEHFGYTDGFGNPDYEGVERNTIPGQGKLMPDGKWAPLATGEFILGYPDEGASCRPARSPTSSGSMARIWRTGSCMRMWRASGSISTKRASSILAARRSWPPSSLEDGRTARRWNCRRIARTRIW
jgi:deferrochelatase/peroxidase EfeB